MNSVKDIRKHILAKHNLKCTCTNNKFECTDILVFKNQKVTYQKGAWFHALIDVRGAAWVAKRQGVFKFSWNLRHEQQLCRAADDDFHTVPQPWTTRTWLKESREVPPALALIHSSFLFSSSISNFYHCSKIFSLKHWYLQGYRATMLLCQYTILKKHEAILTLFRAWTYSWTISSLSSMASMFISVSTFVLFFQKQYFW